MKTKIVRIFILISALLAAAPAFFFTTYQLFLAERGMSILQMSLINAVFMASVFILEVPTGAFADSFGRRRSIIAGCFAWGLSFYLYYFSHRFSAFLLAEIIGAIGSTLISGALEAWVVDSLKWQQTEISLEKLFRYEEKVGQIGIIAGSFLGAIAGGRDLALPWLLSGSGMIIAGLCALKLMSEPYFAKKSWRFEFRPLINTAQESWQAGKENPAFWRIAGLSAIFALSVQSLNMQWTLFFRDGFHLPVWSLGLIYAAIAAFTALGSHFAPLAAKKGRHEGQGLAIAFFIIGLMMILGGRAGIFLPALSFFLLHEFGRGLFKPLKRSIINRRLEGKNRATMLSLESMASHAGAFFGLIGGGWLGNHYSISIAWAGSGFLLMLTVPFLWKKGI